MDTTIIKKPVNVHRQFQDLFMRMYPELVDERNTSGGMILKGEGQSNLLTKTITFIVTENCSLRCTYCYQCNKDFHKVMDKETARKAVDMILDDSKMVGYISSKDTPGIILEFIGGEPLLEAELIEYIIEYFLYKAVSLNHPWYKYHMFSMTSNGTHYFTPPVQRLLQKYKTRMSITITIDGDKDLHDSCRVFPDGGGSYDIVEKAVIHARDNYGLKTSKVTLAPENVMYLNKAIKHLMDLGLTDINANCVYEDVWNPLRDAPILYEEMMILANYMIDNKLYSTSYCSLFDDTIGQPMLPKENQNWCGGNGQMLAIGCDGKLYPCLRFMKYSLADKELPEMEIGDIDRGIDKQENNDFLLQLNTITRKSQSTQECFNCSVASGCAWCTGYNYDVFKTPNKRATFICEMHKARVLANYYYWNRLYEIHDIKEHFSLNLSEEDIKMITRGKDIKIFTNKKDEV